MSGPGVWVGPERPSGLVEAVRRGGGRVVGPEDADAIVWSSRDHSTVRGVESLRELLTPRIRWVQLDAAGIERWVDADLLDGERTWTRASDAFAAAVAEHALAFVLAAARRLPQSARLATWSELGGERVAGRTVGIVGAGSIGRELLARLKPLGVRTFALTRSGGRVEGADESLPATELDRLLEASDYVLLCAPLTAQTAGMIGRRELDLIGPTGWILNVARGGLVRTDELVQALAEGALGGACLDVTDPEPLPDGHPLWSFDNVLVTPHVANTWAMLDESYAEFVAENVARFAKGEPLLSVVEPEHGY